MKQELTRTDAYPTLISPKKPVLFPFVMKQNRPAYVRGLKTEKVHVFKSAKKPFLLTFQLCDNDPPPSAADTDTPTQSRQSPTTCEPDVKTLQIIVKYNDDVRPDVMVL